MLNLSLALLVIFALFCIVARLLHRYFLYIPDPKRVDPHEAGLTGVEEIVFKSAEGKKLIAWYRPAAKGKRTLLYFPGNSGNVAARAGKIKAIVADGYGVFIVNYRGFGGSAGRPTEKRLVRDAVTAYDTLRGLGVPPRDIVLYGESLGTGVATQVCQQREAEGLVLESPFTSVVDRDSGRCGSSPLERYRRSPLGGSMAGAGLRAAILSFGRDALTPARRYDKAGKGLPGL